MSKWIAVLGVLCIIGCTEEPYSPDPPWDGYPADETGFQHPAGVENDDRKPELKS